MDAPVCVRDSSSDACAANPMGAGEIAQYKSRGVRDRLLGMTTSPVVRKAEAWPEPLAPLLPEVQASDQFWARAANHFRLRLFRQHQRTQLKARADEMLQISPEDAPRVAMALADRLLWRMVPTRLKPPGWPRNEADFAKMHGTSVFGMRIWMRLGGYAAVESRVGPLWTEEDVTKELTDRLTERAMADLEPEDPKYRAEPRYVELALKARKVIGADGKTINKLTVNNSGVNIIAPEASEVRSLLLEVTKAAKDLGLTEGTGGIPESGEVVEAAARRIEAEVGGGASE